MCHPLDQVDVPGHWISKLWLCHCTCKDWWWVKADVEFSWILWIPVIPPGNCIEPTAVFGGNGVASPCLIHPIVDYCCWATTAPGRRMHLAFRLDRCRGMQGSQWDDHQQRCCNGQHANLTTGSADLNRSEKGFLDWSTVQLGRIGMYWILIINECCLTHLTLRPCRLREACWIHCWSLTPQDSDGSKGSKGSMARIRCHVSQPPRHCRSVQKVWVTATSCQHSEGCGVIKKHGRSTQDFWLPPIPPGTTWITRNCRWLLTFADEPRQFTGFWAADWWPVSQVLLGDASGWAHSAWKFCINQKNIRTGGKELEMSRGSEPNLPCRQWNTRLTGWLLNCNMGFIWANADNPTTMASVLVYV